jgi:ABC-type transporter Mla MlaB component
MESGLTKAMSIIALTCFLVAGSAAVSVLGRDSVPAARAEMTSPIVRSPVANRESKQDRLAVATLALASFEPPQTSSLSEPLRQAYAASSSADIEAAGAITSAVAPPAVPAKPKLAARPAPQKSYALLSDVQIAGIKERLRLSADQEHYWPAVETALRAVARKIHATRQVDPHTTGAPIDPDAAEVQQLKSAAMPLLFQLREDQKQEVRTLARLIGLEKVAAQI